MSEYLSTSFLSSHPLPSPFTTNTQESQDFFNQAAPIFNRHLIFAVFNTNQHYGRLQAKPPATSHVFNLLLQLSSSFHSDTSPLSIQGSDQRLSLSAMCQNCDLSHFLALQNAKVSIGATSSFSLTKEEEAFNFKVFTFIQRGESAQAKSFTFCSSISCCFLWGISLPSCIPSACVYVTEIVGINNIHSVFLSQ